MKLLYLAFLVALLASCKSEEGAIDTSNWETYEGANYTIKYPQDWTLDVDGMMNTSFFISSPLGGDDTFSENINLLTQDLTRFPMSLDEYVELSINQVETLVPEGHLKKEERLNGPKYAYHSVLYSARFNDNRLMTAQYYWVIENTAYILTFTALAADYEEYRALGYGIMNSFSID
jgi:hypothetical protein